MKKWIKENWFPLVLVLELGIGMLIIGFVNGWS